MPDIESLLADENRPLIMGIINATPDSFSDGGKYLNVDRAMDRIHLMLSNGAEIIDIGGESTRPGSDPVSEEEELQRVLPVLEKAIQLFPDAVYSIDTTKYRVAKEALELGATVVNDVSGMQKEPRLAEVCAEHDAAYILMHSQGDPKTMQKDPSYDDAVEDIYSFLEEKVKLAREHGVRKLIVDPGIGFGKTLEHNLKLIAQLHRFLDLNLPILIGASRKSMIAKILDGRPVDQRLAGTLSLHYHALMKGARILRVHDVREASDSVRIFRAIQSES